MATCDPAGPTVVYISKMVPAAAKASKQFVAFGRVFSGTVAPGQRVYVLGPSYVPGSRDFAEARIAGVVVMMAGKTRSVETAGAGQIVGLLGLDKHIAKSCTVVSSLQAFPMRVGSRLSPPNN